MHGQSFAVLVTPLMLPSVGVFSLAGSFRCLFLLFGLSARFVLLGCLLGGFIFVRFIFSTQLSLNESHVAVFNLQYQSILDP
jgi:hypothetical protein